MALTIEDGTGVTGAQAYANAAAYVAWATAHVGAAPTDTTTAIEAAILRSVARLETLRWVGAKVNGRAQALAWPRSDALDAEGNDIAETEIPSEVITAQHAMTQAELASPGALSPNVTLAGQKVLTKVDVLAWEVQKAPNTVDAARVQVTAAMDAIRALLAGGDSTTRMLTRA
jgi:hypothetical protein